MASQRESKRKRLNQKGIKRNRKIDKEGRQHQRRVEEHFLPNFIVCILMFTLHSPAGGTSDSPESTRGLTLSPISRPPKCPWSLSHSYWWLISLDSSGLYFLQPLTPVPVFHLKISFYLLHSSWSKSSAHLDDCRHFGRLGIFYGQWLTGH